jgi:hypothetical protein
MTFKLRDVAKVSRGNKKDFESNLLTVALAKRQAKKDMKKFKKTNSKK